MTFGVTDESQRQIINLKKTKKLGMLDKNVKQYLYLTLLNANTVISCQSIVIRVEISIDYQDFNTFSQKIKEY